MRDYIYLWHQPKVKRVVASGIEFRDVVPELAGAGGVVLLRHQFDEPSFEPRNRFAFLSADRLARLAADNIYGYGDFCWADFGRDVALADLADMAVAELTFFAHAARPLGAVDVPGLGNRFLYWGHDDGWYARIFYSQWGAIAPMLDRMLSGMLNTERATAVSDLIRRGEAALWCRDGTAVECEQTEDIDALQRKHLTRPRSGPPRQDAAR